MKQRIRLTEQDLHRIVKESVEKTLNKSNCNSLLIEKYSTPALNDRIKYSDHATFGDIANSKDENIDNLREIYLKLCKLVDFADWAFKDAANGQNNLKRYFDYTLKCLHRALACMDRVNTISQMNTGIQPQSPRYKEAVDVYDPYNPRP